KTQAWFTGELYYHGKPYANDSRVILKRMVKKAADLGYRVNLGIEPEFYLLRKDAEGKLKTLGPDYKGVCPAYDLNLTTHVMSTLDKLAGYMDELGWNLYSFDQEGGRGQYEFDFGYTDVLASSDQLTFLRLMIKRLADEIGGFATFMPKPFATEFRSGAHFNISLEDITTGRNIFAPDPDQRGAMATRYGADFSDSAYQFTAGLLTHAPALTALTCPTYNSYQGLIARGAMADMSWAPVVMAYGRNNRSAMLRMPANRYCIENRAPDMSCNPYLAAAFHIAAGLEGMEQKLDPGEPQNRNAYELGSSLSEQRKQLLPRTLLHALEAFDDDPLVETVFGEFKNIFLTQKMREWESSFYRITQEQLDDKLTFI
ncbi:MAG TPA: type III glutamate--ammonia ligase, partial [Cellvibrionaceae bacterium]